MGVAPAARSSSVLFQRVGAHCCRQFLMSRLHCTRHNVGKRAYSNQAYILLKPASLLNPNALLGWHFSRGQYKCSDNQVGSPQGLSSNTPLRRHVYMERYTTAPLRSAQLLLTNSLLGNHCFRSNMRGLISKYESLSTFIECTFTRCQVSL